jgi:hypothetical protein
MIREALTESLPQVNEATAAKVRAALGELDRPDEDVAHLRHLAQAHWPERLNQIADRLAALLAERDRLQSLEKAVRNLFTTEEFDSYMASSAKIRAALAQETPT